MSVAPIRAPQDHLPPTKKLPRRIPVGIYLDDSLADVHDAAVAALQQARARLDSTRARRLAGGNGPDPAELDAEDAAELAPLEAAVDAALAALDAGTVWYWFRGIGREAFRSMIKRHPATEEDHEVLRARSGNPAAIASHDAEKIAPELVKAACFEPKLTDEEITEIFTSPDWNDEEVAALYATALAAQASRRGVDHRRPPVAPGL